MAIKEFWKLNNSRHELFIFKILDPFPNDKFKVLPNLESLRTTISKFEESGREFSLR